MMATIKEAFPIEAEYEIPSGGLFAWVKLPKHVDTRAVLQKRLKTKLPLYLVVHSFQMVDKRTL